MLFIFSSLYCFIETLDELKEKEVVQVLLVLLVFVQGAENRGRRTKAGVKFLGRKSRPIAKKSTALNICVNV